MKKILILLFFISIITNVFAEAGPPIPNPEVSLSEASQIAFEYFKKNEIENEYFMIDDYFVISGEYKYFGDIYKSLDGWLSDSTNNEKYLEKVKDYWAWEIKIIHPVANDISVTYKITNSKQVIELERTN